MVSVRKVDVASWALNNLLVSPGVVTQRNE